MIEAQYRTGNGRIIFKLQGENQKELFEGIAGLQEVFEADYACGCCGDQNVRFRVRKVTKGSKIFTYYHLQCTKAGCYARFNFGQASDGSDGLFPKRRDDEGKPLPNRGWEKWVPKDDNNHDE